jgi:alkanesulfonate monooxygenase SsuD/methylene tetrahydromethanopterin reductase-like flavin-dependent oxidoreductase (luciferase family)
MQFGTVMSCSGPLHEGAPENTPLYERVLELSKAAEAAGVAYLWTQEHHMINMLQSPSALIAAVQIAQHTTVRVGTAVVVLPYRNAIQAAGEIAQADNAMNGRLELGVARGAYGYEFEKFGIPFETSRDQFIETLEAVRLLLGNEECESSFHGKFVNFEDVYIWPRPVQKPMPPMWMGAQSPAAIEDAARRGYNVMTALFLWDDDHAASLAAAFKRGQADSDRKDTKFCASRYAYVAQDQQDAEARIDELLDHWRVHQQLHDFSHTTNPRGIIRPRVQESEPTRQQIRDTMMIGTADHFAEKARRYAGMGIDLLNLGINYGPPQDKLLQSLQAMAPVIASVDDSAAASVT